MKINLNDLSYGELHGHSDASLLDGVGSAYEHVKSSQDLKHCGCCLTDHGTMRNCFSLYQAGKKLKQKIIMGMEAYTCINLEDKGYYHNTLLAINEIGYKNLCYLRSVSSHKDHRSKWPIRPRNTYEEIFNHNEGLVATSGCISSIVSRLILDDKNNEAEEWLLKFKKVFGDRYFIEIHLSVVDTKWDSKTKKHISLNQDLQAKINKVLLEFSQKHNIKAFFVQDSHLPTPEHYEVQKMMMLNNKQNKDGWFFDKSYHKKSIQEMYSFVKENIDYITDEQFVELTNNSKLVYDMVDYSKLEFPKQFAKVDHEKHESWKHPIKDYKNLHWQKLVGLSKENKDLELALKIISKHNRLKDDNRYFERLYEEIQIIEFNGTVGLISYFFPIEDVANMLRKKGKLIPFGRGSGASSLFCYLIGISGIDPIVYNLLFERFLTVERIESGSFPDFDYDCEDREEIISFLISKYSKDYVALISTKLFIKIKSAIKEVLRAKCPEITPVQLDILTKEVEQFEKNEMPESIQESLPHIKFEYLLDHIETLKRIIQKKPELKNVFLKALGTVKTTSIHAGGVVIGNKPLWETLPIEWNDKEECYVTEYPMDEVEGSGLIKYDFLKIETLKQIRITIDRIRETQGKHIELYDIPFDDLVVLDQFRLGKTTSIFQFDSDISRGILTKCKTINHLDILIAITALGRPGPLKNGTHLEFIKRINDPSKIIYKHPDLTPILKSSYGLVIFQEDIQLIVQRLGGMGKHDSSLLLKAFSKKTKDKILTYKDQFVNGCLKNGYTEALANDLWVEMESFGLYGFNRSHSASYSCLSYCMMWLKHYYPIEYMMSILELAKKEDIQLYMKDWGDIVLKPDVNYSMLRFTTIEQDGKTKIQMPLLAINGINEANANIIINNRPYKDYADFVIKTKGAVGKLKTLRKKTDEVENEEDEETTPDKINKTTLSKLIYSGALDTLIGSQKGRIEKIIELEQLNPKVLGKKDKDIFKEKNPTLDESLFKEQWQLFKKKEEEKRINSIRGMSFGELITKELELLNFSNFDYYTVFKNEARKKSLALWGSEVKKITDINKYMNKDEVVILAGFFERYAFTVKNPNSKIYQRKMLTFNLRNGDSSIKVIVFPDSLEAENQQDKKFGHSGLISSKDYNPCLVKGKVSYNEDTKEISIIFNEMVLL